MVTTTETRTERGVSLARGPALIVGTILLAMGLYALYREHTFPPFSNFPNGSAPVEGKVFHIFGANGWTGMLTAVGGGLLLFGAAEHLVAKTMSLIVGAALGAAAVIALISGNVLGMAAANGWTELGWGIAAAILLVNTLTPRRRTTVAADDEAAMTDGRGRSRFSRRRRAAPAAAAGAAAGAAYEHHHLEHRRAEEESAPAARDQDLEQGDGVRDERAGETEPAEADRERDAEAAETHVHH